MPIAKKEEQLALSVRIPRALHDRIDEVRALAKKIGCDYEINSVVVEVLEKDVEKSLKELKKLAAEVNSLENKPHQKN